MLDRAAQGKQKLDEAMSQMCQVSWMFSKHPGKDFSGTKKLPFSKVISFLLAMEGGTLTSELLKFFGCSSETASASAFVQQRSKFAPETFPILSMTQRYFTSSPFGLCDSKSPKIPTIPL